MAEELSEKAKAALDEHIVAQNRALGKDLSKEYRMRRNNTGGEEGAEADFQAAHDRAQEARDRIAARGGKIPGSTPKRRKH